MGIEKEKSFAKMDVAGLSTNPLSSKLRAEVVRNIEAELEEKLPEYMLPSKIVCLNDLPKLSNGKVDKNRLPNPFLSRSDSQENYVAPRDDVELQIVSLFEEVLGTYPISVRDNYTILGGDSLSALRLIGKLRMRFSYEIELATLFSNRSIEEIATEIRNEGAKAQSVCVPLNTSNSNRKLFCFHGGGGSILSYASLAQTLRRAYFVYGVQAKGLLSDERPASNVEEMVKWYVSDIQKVQPQGPYRFLGWSFGGVLALEVAREIRKQGKDVQFVCIVDSIVRNQRISETKLQATFAEQLEKEIGFTLDVGKAEDGALLRQIESKLVDTGRMPEGIGIKDVERLLCVAKANLRAISGYSFRKRIDVPVLSIRAEQSLGERSGGNICLPPSMLTDAFSAEVRVPGDHFSIMARERVSKVAECLMHWLDTGWSVR